MSFTKVKMAGKGTVRAFKQLDGTHAKPRAKRLVADCAESTVANNATVAESVEITNSEGK